MIKFEWIEYLTQYKSILWKVSAKRIFRLWFRNRDPTFAAWIWANRRWSSKVVGPS